MILNCSNLLGKVIFSNRVDALLKLFIPLPLPPVSNGSVQYSVGDFGSFWIFKDFPSRGWGMYLLPCYRCFSATTLAPVATFLLGLFVAFVTATPGAAPQLGSGPHPVTNLRVLSPSCQIQKWIVRDEIKTEPPRHFCRGQDRKWICCWWGTNEGGCSSKSGILKGAPDVELRSY